MACRTLPLLICGTHSMCRVDNRQEIPRLQTRPADEGAVDIRLAEQGGRVVGFDAAAVLNDEFVGGVGTDELAGAAADEGVGVLGLLRRGVEAGADGPDRF